MSANEEPWDLLWARLQSDGWTIDVGFCGTRLQSYYLPPGAYRGPGQKLRVHYFDSKKGVRRHLETQMECSRADSKLANSNGTSEGVAGEPALLSQEALNVEGNELCIPLTSSPALPAGESVVGTSEQEVDMLASSPGLAHSEGDILPKEEDGSSKRAAEKLIANVLGAGVVALLKGIPGVNDMLSDTSLGPPNAVAHCFLDRFFTRHLDRSLGFEKNQATTSMDRFIPQGARLVTASSEKVEPDGDCLFAALSSHEVSFTFMEAFNVTQTIPMSSLVASSGDSPSTGGN